MDYARSQGYLAMQFNFVVDGNEPALRLWRSLSFAVLGRLPQAFKHPRNGYVDALVMYRSLGSGGPGGEVGGLNRARPGTRVV